MDWADPISLEPVFEIPKRDGKGMTNVIHIARAKELDLLPRVTGIISAVLGDSYTLGQYRARCNILAGEQIMREEGEHDDDYISRVQYAGGEASRRSRDRGTEVHQHVLVDFLQHGQASTDPASCMLIDDLHEMLENIGAEGVTSEKAIGGRDTGYVGRPDLYVASCNAMALEPYATCLMPNKRVQLVIDLKTTNLHKFKRPYREHKYQFGGYGNLLNLGEDALFMHWYADPWTGQSKWIVPPDTMRWREAFQCLYRAWLVETNFDREDY
jgi:hypothetical protein